MTAQYKVSSVRGLHVFEEITNCLLQQEKAAILALFVGVVDPGHPDKLKMMTMYNRVKKGLLQIIKSLNSEKSTTVMYLPKVMETRYLTHIGKAFSYWNFEINNAEIVSLEVPKVLTDVQQSNIEIWKGDYGLLLWELEIRKVSKPN